MLAGDTRAQSCIKTQQQDELPAESYGRQLLSPGATPPSGLVSQGKQVCTCMNVSEQAIATHLAHSTLPAPQRLQSLQDTLGCGTQCGSCIPELQRLLRECPSN